jgi:formylglycine-generating enzyme required for sulfatase activity/serine/threonine protein kinase
MARMLPQYDQWEVLGHGGMGAVYRARQVNLDRRVAIKVLPPEAADDEAQFIERFKNEARTMAKLDHPAIVAVYDFGETTEGQLYFVMAYVDGTDVSQMIKEQERLPSEHALAITTHVCDALQYAHDRNVIHRDIKPANILINREGEVKVADFGLAKMNDPANALGLTKSGMAMGTPDFVAPEAMMLGVTVDHRADLYAIGVMLYQMLTGKIPRGVFSAATRHVPELDPRFDDVITRAMAEDREERYQSAGEIRRDLDAILTTPYLPPKKQFSFIEVPPPQVEPVHAIQAHAPLPQPVRRSTAPPPPQKSGAGSIMVLGVIAALAAGAFYFLKRPKPLPDPQAPRDPIVAVTSSQSHTPESGQPAQPSAVLVPANSLSASKAVPFVNSLGMRFVPVPGTATLFCIHETRRQDYAAYAAETPGLNGSWKNVNFEGFELSERVEEHPVNQVSWDEARAFCQWLSRREGKSYRLPTDREWSYAVGDEQQGNASAGASEIRFPWGTQWPPLKSAGNYSDSSRKERAPRSFGQFLEGYDDGFPTTAPVMSFAANELGIHDLGGNVWEWCEDYNSEHKAGVLRGGSWGNGVREQLATTNRAYNPPDAHSPTNGFRCVLDLSVPFVAPQASPMANAASVSTPDPKASMPAGPAPVVAAPPPSGELDKHLASLEQAFQAAVERDANAAFKLSVAALDKSYLGALDRAIATGTQGGKLEDTLALKAERHRIVNGEGVPSALDEGTRVASKTPEPLNILRQTYRSTMAQHEAVRLKAMQPLYEKYDQALAALQADLTKESHFDDATRVKTLRSRISAAGDPGAAAPSIESFTNTLGMKFVPVPDTNVLFCIHETRRQDYAAFASDVPNVNGTWKNSLRDGIPCGNEGNHPVVGVSWDDARAFCAWLGAKEGRTYRLATDLEWSVAVGIDRREYRTKDTTPEMLNSKLQNVFPWDGAYPPQTGQRAGNYADTAWRQAFPASQSMDGYTDGFATTAPVMSFAPNKFGLYDLGGNAWEWVEDWYNTAQTERVMRGGSFCDAGNLLSSARFHQPPTRRESIQGFRCVLELHSAAEAPTAASSPAPATQRTNPTAAIPTRESFTNSLGMKFVEVAGTRVRFCIHLTRVKDYATYEAATPGVDGSWRRQQRDGVPIGVEDDHPVVGVSWEDSKAFCAWLSQKEGLSYRLPTDREWSLAVGIGRKENFMKDTTPESLSNKLQNEYPWGPQWPPPKGAGNFADTSCKEKFPGMEVIPDFTDGFPSTSPVMEFKPNRTGLYDMSGNVWQWCEDWWNAAKSNRVSRGGSWTRFAKGDLFSSHRDHRPPFARGYDSGFRVVQVLANP